MKKLINLIKYWLGIKPGWKDCRKSSNWFGSNANIRIMNILSPNFSEQQFKDRVKKCKDRGVDHFNLFLVNKGDGEAAGYRATDDATAKVMDKRIRHLRKQGYGIVLWCMADDSSAWSKNFDMEALMKVCKKYKWTDEASMFVVGLECDEYWSAGTVQSHVATIKRYFKGKVGVHQVSGKTSYAPYADVMFYQTNPGKNKAQIAAETLKARGCGKPVCFFELERHENRELCEAALANGAFSVGNW